MKLIVIIRMLGALFMLSSATLIAPLAVSLWDADGEWGRFLLLFAAAAALGFALWWPARQADTTIRTRDGFAIVAMMWTAMSLLGSVPFMLTLDLSFADAVFESASGYTTTGATVLSGLDAMPRSILLYRQELQWVGGIGVIVLSVAMLPVLGVGGMQLYRAEVPGPFKDERMTPRIARTARRLSELYAAFTAVCALCYWLAGMDIFDAITHGMATVATGGYSTHDASMAYFDSPVIEAIAIVFMLIGGISFSVHYLAWRMLHLRLYGQDTQTRVFLLIAAALTAFVAIVLYATGEYETGLESIRYAAFQVVSVITTTGFATANFALWPLALPVLLIFSSFIGGCAGSTSGGLKVIRVVILAKQAGVHVRRLIHPRSQTAVRIDGRTVPESISDGIWGFFTVYVAVFAVLMVVLMLDGVDQVTAFGAVSASMNNLGPALGDVAVTFASMSDHSTLLMAFSMLLGRLEIFTFLVLLTPAFWRR